MVKWVLEENRLELEIPSSPSASHLSGYKTTPTQKGTEVCSTQENSFSQNIEACQAQEENFLPRPKSQLKPPRCNYRINFVQTSSSSLIQPLQHVTNPPYDLYIKPTNVPASNRSDRHEMTSRSFMSPEKERHGDVTIPSSLTSSRRACSSSHTPDNQSNDVSVNSSCSDVATGRAKSFRDVYPQRNSDNVSLVTTKNKCFSAPSPKPPGKNALFSQSLQNRSLRVSPQIDSSEGLANIPQNSTNNSITAYKRRPDEDSTSPTPNQFQDDSLIYESNDISQRLVYVRHSSNERFSDEHVKEAFNEEDKSSVEEHIESFNLKNKLSNLENNLISCPKQDINFSQNTGSCQAPEDKENVFPRRPKSKLKPPRRYSWINYVQNSSSSLSQPLQHVTNPHDSSVKPINVPGNNSSDRHEMTSRSFMSPEKDSQDDVIISSSLTSSRRARSSSCTPEKQRNNVFVNSSRSNTTSRTAKSFRDVYPQKKLNKNSLVFTTNNGCSAPSPIPPRKNALFSRSRQNQSARVSPQPFSNEEFATQRNLIENSNGAHQHRPDSISPTSNQFEDDSLIYQSDEISQQLTYEIPFKKNVRDLEKPNVIKFNDTNFKNRSKQDASFYGTIGFCREHKDKENFLRRETESKLKPLRHNCGIKYIQNGTSGTIEHLQNIKNPQSDFFVKQTQIPLINHLDCHEIMSRNSFARAKTGDVIKPSFLTSHHRTQSSSNIPKKTLSNVFENSSYSKAASNAAESSRDHCPQKSLNKDSSVVIKDYGLSAPFPKPPSKNDLLFQSYQNQPPRVSFPLHPSEELLLIPQNSIDNSIVAYQYCSDKYSSTTTAQNQIEDTSLTNQSDGIAQPFFYEMPCAKERLFDDKFDKAFSNEKFEKSFSNDKRDKSFSEEKLEESFSNEKLAKNFSNEKFKETPSDQKLKKTFSNEKFEETLSNQKSKEPFSNEKLENTFSNEKLKENFNNEKFEKILNNQNLKETFSNEKLEKSFSNETLKENCNNEKFEEILSNQKLKETFNNEKLEETFSNEKLENTFSNEKPKKNFSNEKLEKSFSNEKLKENFNNEKFQENLSDPKLKESFNHEKLENAFSNEKLKKAFSDEKLEKSFSNEKLEKSFSNEKLKQAFSNKNFEKILINKELKENFNNDKLENILSVQKLKETFSNQKLKKTFSNEKLEQTFSNEKLEKSFSNEKLKESFSNEKFEIVLSDQKFKETFSNENLKKTFSMEKLEKSFNNEEKLKEPFSDEKLEKPLSDQKLEKTFSNEKCEETFDNEKFDEIFINAQLKNTFSKEKLDKTCSDQKLENTFSNDKCDKILSKEKFEETFNNLKFKEIFSDENLERTRSIQKFKITLSDEKLEKNVREKKLEETFSNEKLEKSFSNQTLQKTISNEKVEKNLYNGKFEKTLIEEMVVKTNSRGKKSSGDTDSNCRTPKENNVSCLLSQIHNENLNTFPVLPDSELHLAKEQFSEDLHDIGSILESNGLSWEDLVSFGKLLGLDVEYMENASQTSSASENLEAVENQPAKDLTTSNVFEETKKRDLNT